MRKRFASRSLRDTMLQTTKLCRPLHSALGASYRNIALQGNVVAQVWGSAPRIPGFTMPLEAPATPSRQTRSDRAALVPYTFLSRGTH